jgi:hypothetical protein
MVSGLMPTRIGFTSALAPTSFVSSNTEIVETTGVGYTPRGLAYFDANGDQQFIFGIAYKLYRYPGNADISRAAAYTNGQFSFAQWRNNIYGVNGADLLQKSTTGAFADVASTPKLTRIAVAGEYMAGIGLVANFVGTARTVTASAYMLMISAVGNPEQFDVDVDTTAYYQDIYDSGGPLIAVARLRDFFVVFQKSGVYVVEQNPDPSIKWTIRKVTDYYGCEWPDSVIEVNNVLYWISPTHGGEVCAFDGAQVSVLSGAIQTTIASGGSGYVAGFLSGGGVALRGGLVASSDGETILWRRYWFTDGANEFNGTSLGSAALYMNIPTGRFGYAADTVSAGGTLMTFSNAWQDAMLAVVITKRQAGDNRFKAGYMIAGSGGRIEFFRGGREKVKISNITLTFSETPGNPSLNGQTSMSVSMGLMPIATASAFPAYSGTPTLSWLSTQNSGDSISKTEATALTLPTGTWNANTCSFDIPPATARSQSAKVFAFTINVTPITSLIGITVKAEPAGTSQAGGKANIWQ